MKTANTKVNKSNNESLIDQAAEQWVNLVIQHINYNRNNKKDDKLAETTQNPSSKNKK